MKLATGVDMVDIQRFQETLERHGERFLRRIFTSQELDEVGSNVTSLAGRFAAKEAVSKALGTGIGLVSWHDIVVLRGAQREPLLSLHGAAIQLAGERGLGDWALSISHTHTHAIAVVVACGGEEGP